MVLNRKGLEGCSAATTVSALMKTSGRRNQSELKSYTYYPMRNEHQKKTTEMKISSECSSSFIAFQTFSLHLFSVDFLSFLVSSLVSPAFCLFQKTTFKEIKVEKRSSCLSYLLKDIQRTASCSVAR